jgi:hypothetical protein
MSNEDNRASFGWLPEGRPAFLMFRQFWPHEADQKLPDIGILAAARSAFFSTTSKDNPEQLIIT